MVKNYLNLNLVRSTFITTAILCVVTMLSACSGSDDDVEPVVPDQSNKVEEMIDVQLGFNGDPICVSESPLSRVGETKKKIYGINVYYREGNDSYYNYAYGLFDNVADMKISLISKYTYKFVCTIVQDDKDELYVNNDNYYYPFTYSGWDYTKLENKFHVSTTNSVYLYDLGSGYSTIKNGSSSINKNYPCTDRLYGELENYVPTDGGTATINMKRTAFGTKLVITPPADGSLDVQLGSVMSETITSTDATKTIETLCTFYSVYDCWQKQEDYAQDFNLNLTWKRANGATQTFNKTITMKRNVMTTVNVSVAGSTGDSTIGLNEESTAMGSATVNATFNGGSQDDNNVNPQ